MPQHSDQDILSRFGRELDKVEQRAPMHGGFARIDPYIIERQQYGSRFRMIIFHRESAVWFDNDRDDACFAWLRDHRWVRRGDVVFDLGCNVGFHTLWYAMQVGRNGHVHGFDPYRWNTAAVCFNAELNGLGNVTAHTVGLADRTAVMPISISDPRILNGSDTAKFDAVIRPITDYAHLRPNFMKIDIEGAEYEVSLSDFGAFNRLRAMFVELHEPFIRERALDPRTCVNNFCAQGFDVFIDGIGATRYRPDGTGPIGRFLYLSRKRKAASAKLLAPMKRAVGRLLFNKGRKAEPPGA